MQNDFDRSLEQQFENPLTNKGYGANNQFAATDRNDIDPGRNTTANEGVAGAGVSALTSDRVYRPTPPSINAPV